MSKKPEHYEDAERLYVCENLKLYAIAAKLSLSEKTVRNWKKENGWDEKRKKYLQSKQDFHQELYEFSRELMHSIREDIKKGEKVEPGRMFAFTRLLPLITKVKDYEDVVYKNKKDTPQGLSEEVIDRIQEEILGIKPKRIDKE